MAGFQKQANIYLAPGVPGQFASTNPFSAIVAGPGGLVAGFLGCVVGKFAWITYAIAGGPGVANSFGEGGVVPDGFVGADMQALITDFLGSDSMVVPSGIPVTLFDRGDFWAQSFGEAAIGQKAFANLFTGDVLAAASGAFPTTSFGSAVIAAATLVAGSYSMNVTAVTSGVLAVGQLVSGAGIAPGTFIESLGNGSGSTGTYNLSRAAQVAGTAVAIACAVPAAVGGAVATCSCSSASPTMTVTTLTAGSSVVAGMLVSGTNVPAGTYIAGIVSGGGGNGSVITLSANASDTISGASIKFSSWVETPFVIKSAGNVGDVIKIGVKN